LNKLQDGLRLVCYGNPDPAVKMERLLTLRKFLRHNTRKMIEALTTCNQRLPHSFSSSSSIRPLMINVGRECPLHFLNVAAEETDDESETDDDSA
jgi:hypothetical protein